MTIIPLHNSMAVERSTLSAGRWCGTTTLYSRSTLSFVRAFWPAAVDVFVPRGEWFHPIAPRSVARLSITVSITRHVDRTPNWFGFNTIDSIERY